MPTHTIKITGMTCQACATRLEKVLNKKPSVQLAQVNFATETLSLDLNEAVSDEEVLTWIKKTGFTGQIIKNTTQNQETNHQNLPYHLIALAVLSTPFWLGMVGMMFGTHALMPPNWVQFMLASIAQFGLGRHFYQGAWASVRGGLLGMDMLVVLGTSAIWAYSVYAWQHGEHVYFEASVMILTFVSLGKYLEHRTKTGSLNALHKLMQLLPQTVPKKEGDTWISTPLSNIQINDILQAKHGDKIAVDGIVIGGHGDITQAHLTGESHYLPKNIGDTVLAGSMVVDGSIIYQACATGDKTALGQMTQALAHAQGTKAPISRLADRVAGIFVPIVMTLSLLTFLGNLYLLGEVNAALMRAAAVLVIACPCALGLATPTAIMAGMGVASRHGVQFLDASTLEMAGQIKIMAFDKTGTLTQGKPSVVDIHTTINQTLFLDMVASLESHSNHPLALAICQYTKPTTTFNITNITSVSGLGMQGDIQDIGTIKAGTADFANAPTDFGEFSKAHPTASLIFVSLNNQPIGVIALSDTLKSSANTLIHHLKSEGIYPIILSGDRQSVVDDVAKKLGVVGFGELSPQDKANKIKELQIHHKTAMIGDGINDALAMTHADIGMAVSEATDVATGSANVRLLTPSGDATTIYYAYKIAKMTMTNIKQNLFFAFIYNIIGIPLAMMGVLNPMFASLAMTLSSLSVLANALRLQRVNLKDTS